jgi:hypothetical protein
MWTAVKQVCVQRAYDAAAMQGSHTLGHCCGCCTLSGFAVAKAVCCSALDSEL